MSGGRHAQSGVTYLWMLFLVFLLGLGLGKSLEVYSTQIQREKEADLLYVGGLYREAIQTYYLSSPGSVRKYPESLSDLLHDPRHLTTRRHLRQLYPDPVSGEAFEVVLALEGGIRGVRSPSMKRPLKQAGLPAGVRSGGEKAAHYADWLFTYDGG
jgi:type II secretory pathway pseudopilin PulG